MKKSLMSALLASAMLLSLLSGCGKEEEPVITPTPDQDVQQPADQPADVKPVTFGAGASLAQYLKPAGTGTMAQADVTVKLSDSGITVDGAPAPESSGAVYLSHDIIYYEDKTTYASGFPYGEGDASERHSADEAAAHTVVNITEPGAYRITGKLSAGQIRVDLGEDAFEDPAAMVTLILDGAEITCTVAPAVLFLNVYECDNGWTVESAKSTVDTSNAGAKVILAQGSSNRITGSHVARIYKDKEGQKKLWKQDAAFYSYMSMEIDGEGDGTGTLDITADNEGLDTELHLTINGGCIRIRSGDDGINTNEDGVSVTTINGGDIRIMAGLGAEGDGIDSNGWLVINGGTVVAAANPAADAGLDSDMGSYVNGGIVVALGSTMDWAESDSEQVTMNLQFGSYKESDCAIAVVKEDGSLVFAYDPSEDEVVGANVRRFQGAVISCPNFTVGDTYLVYVDGQLSGSETAGLYDPATVTAYENGLRQGYSGTDVIGRPGMGGGFPGGMERPEMPQEGQRPQMPEGFDPNARPEGDKWDKGDRQPPEGFDPGQMPQGGFDPGQMPQGDFGSRPGMGGQDNSIPENSLFFMQDKVNFFTGVNEL